jgi:BirA family transcriptional regulator, biotin operon repressor / biotin---[acetyl-CoA-carboxylase] ligase
VSPEARLRDLLAARGWPWRAPIEHHVSLASTNDRLKDLARAGAAEGSVVLADTQTAGRGRHGNPWISLPGNLYVSVLLRPSSACAPLLPLAAGVAVAEGLEAFGIAARLKWPNDLMVADRKLGGILAEASSSGAAVDWVVVGIGLNVGAPLPPEMAANAVSLKGAGAHLAPVDEVASAVLARLSVWYHRLADSGASVVLDEWRLRSLDWWGHPVEAWSSGQRLVGRAVGVDGEGGLVLEMDDGKKVTLRSGEARRCRPLR